MSSYLWRVLNKSWSFKLPSIGLGLFSLTRRSYSLSFGCWLQIASQDIQNHTAPLTAVIRSPVSLNLSPLMIQNAEVQDRMGLNSSIFPLKSPKYGCLFWGLVQMQMSYLVISNTVRGDTVHAKRMKPCHMSGVILVTLPPYWLTAVLSLSPNPSRLRSVTYVTQTNPELFG